MSCSVLILTKNEERNIAECIQSAAFADDILVFDSFSEDNTINIAERHGARVIRHEFENYGAQREAARLLGDYKHEWVLALDADERVDSELAREIPKALAAAAEDVAAFRVRRKDHFRGKWIRHATLYPSWHLRLYRHRRIRYPERSVHEYPDVDGTVLELGGHLLHDNFSQGLPHWWRRHVKYAELEASELVSAEGTELPSIRELLTRNPVTRRRALKALSYHLPLRPTLRYLYMMLLRGAVLDGPEGWEYCRMIAEYQRMTDQFASELRDGQRRQQEHRKGGGR
ncbi:MAG: glycosyltransferase family 2 protein [Polyangiaceae bacterium]